MRFLFSTNCLKLFILFLI